MSTETTPRDQTGPGVVAGHEDAVPPPGVGARARTRLGRWTRLAVFGAALVGVWQLVVMSGAMSSILLPGPRVTFDELVRSAKLILTGDYLLTSLWITTSEALLGFVLAVVVGFALGCLVGETRFGQDIVMPYLVAINVMPKVAFAPLFVAWFGFGISSKVVLAAFVAFFPIIVDTAAGLASTDTNKVMLFRSLGASRLQTLVKLKLPSAMPYFFAGLKTASVLVVVGAVVGEYLGGGEGMGELIKLSAAQLRLERVFAYITLLSVVGVALFWAVGWCERRFVFWHRPDPILTTQA